MPRRTRYDPDRDYYALLDVPPQASAADIQRAFRRLARVYHPDRNPERPDWATAQFQAINEAYHVLSDADRRREYDRRRWPHARQRRSHRSTASSTGSESPDDTHSHFERTYADWARNAAPPPSAPEFSPQHPLATIRALVRGPFGRMYLLAMVMLFLMPVVALATLGSENREIEGLTTCDDTAMRITSPRSLSTVPAAFEISGTVNDDTVQTYYVEILAPDAGGNDAPLFVGPTHSGELHNGPLATVSLPAEAGGVYTLRLAVTRQDTAETAYPCIIRVRYTPGARDTQDS